jgi:hypothetical protein
VSEPLKELPDFVDAVVERVTTALESCDEDDVAAFLGAGALYPFCRVSEVIERVNGSIAGTFGKREGGLWAAAGTLGAGAGDSVRLAFLGIILQAAGLPEKVEPARRLWLRPEIVAWTKKRAERSRP